MCLAQSGGMTIWRSYISSGMTILFPSCKNGAVSLEYTLPSPYRQTLPISYTAVRKRFPHHSKCNYTLLTSAIKSKVKQTKTGERGARPGCILIQGSMAPLLGCLSSAKLELLVPLVFQGPKWYTWTSVHGNWYPGHHLSCPSCRKSVHSCWILPCSFPHFYLYFHRVLSLVYEWEQSIP